MILFPVPIDHFLPFLICSFALGIILGALYDIFRIRRIAFRGKALKAADFILTLIEDMAFLIFATITMILLSYKLNYGITRWYSCGAAVAGVFLWRKTAGKLVIGLADKIISLIKHTVGWIFKMIISPPMHLLHSIAEKAIKKIENNRAKAYTEGYLEKVLNDIYTE